VAAAASVVAALAGLTAWRQWEEEREIGRAAPSSFRPPRCPPFRLHREAEQALPQRRSLLLLPACADCQSLPVAPAPPHWRGWPHAGAASAFDTASLRRGFEVYRQVCSACHSLRFVSFRQLVGVTHTEQQAKALAASVLVSDVDEETGETRLRPGTLADRLPPPYASEQQARELNHGALPPDLTYIVNVRQPAVSQHRRIAAAGCLSAAAACCLRLALATRTSSSRCSPATAPPLLTACSPRLCSTTTCTSLAACCLCRLL
jgi:hypothetical protein